MLGIQTGGAFAASGYGPSDYDGATRTPIKHVIIIIGEYRTFDHVFATYKPKSGETVSNLLSKGIVNADRTPGANYKTAVRKQGSDYFEYQMSPPSTAYSVPPPAAAGGLGSVAAHQPDPRISYAGKDASHLPSGPFQITSKTHPYDVYDASPVHRLFQIW